MALLSLLLMALWTLAVLRLLAVRATLSTRTFLTFLLLGAMIGPVAVPLAERFIAPYGWGGNYPHFLIAVPVHVLLFLPVWGYLFRRRAYRVTSVADAFLLAFLVGFGYDLLAYLLSSAYGGTPARMLAYLPPWQINGDSYSVVGYSYWTALPALGLAAGLRFWRNRWGALGIGALLLLFAAAEHASLQSPAPNWLVRFGTATGHGAFTGWVALLLLVGLSAWEAHWAARAAQGKVPHFAVLEEWRSLLTALAERKWTEFRRLGATFRLRHQLALARAEAAHDSADRNWPRLLALLEQRLQRAESGAAPATPGLASWARRRTAQLAAVALLVLILVVPLLPQSLNTFFWGIPVVQYVVPSLQMSVLAIVLAGLVLARYGAAPARPFSNLDADEVVRFYAERGILRTALGLVILAVIYGRVEDLYAPAGVLAQFFSGGLPLNHVPLVTIMLAVAAACSGITLARRDRWRRAPLRLQRAAAVRQAWEVGVAMLGVWACLVFFGEAQALVHAHMGAKLFNWFQNNGNSAGDTLAGVLTIVFSYGVFALLFLLTRRVRRFFGDTGGGRAVPPQPAGAAAGGAKG